MPERPGHVGRIVGAKNGGPGEAAAKPWTVRADERPAQPEGILAGPAHDVRIGREDGDDVSREHRSQKSVVGEIAEKDHVLWGA